jgi:hypothetical protein
MAPAARRCAESLSQEIVMRVSHPVLALLAAGVLGCGGSSKPTQVDAAPVACAQSGTLNATAPLDFSQGGQAPGAVPPMGTQLTVSVIVTTTAQADRGFFMDQVNNGGVYTTAAGKAGRFETPPAPGTYPLDTDNNFGFTIDFVDGVTQSGNTASAKPTQVALLDPAAGGTLKIDSFTPAVPGGTSTIAATITNAKFKGFNVLANGMLDQTGNGCDITLQKFQFTGLSVKWQTAAFPAAVAPPAAVVPAAIAPPVSAPVIDGVTAMSADFRIE